MNSLWQQLTLSTLSIQEWRSNSYLYRLVGSLQNWRSGSFLIAWGDAIATLLVSLVFVLAPFVTSNDLIGLLLFACGCFWLLLTLSDQGKLSITPIHLLVLLYWGIATVATSMSPVKTAAFVGWGKLTLYLLFFTLMARILRSPRIRSWLITLYLHICLIVSVYGVRQWIEGVKPLATWNDPMSSMAKETRVYSYLNNPNLLGAYLLPAIALSLAAFFTWRGKGPKALALTMLIVNCACLRYTGSRGAWIGFLFLIIAFGILLWFWWRNYLPPFWRTWSLPIGLVSFIGGLLLVIVVVEPLRNRVLSIFADRDDSSNNFRRNVWDAVLMMIAHRPILGIGPGNTAFNKIYPIYMHPRFSALSAYSIWLELLVETGIIGFSAFMWLLVVTFNQGWTQLLRLRQINSQEVYWLIAAIATMVGMLCHGVVDTVWYRPEINTLWWLMIAIIASYHVLPQSEPIPENEPAS